ncbi:DUF1366 domain-containing protein [Streptococcus gallolyticus subsp. gallolyticus]|uniref:DUF1366 domain-containing protein n=1 Tax=Streptococcus gallolyticus TaxID=315405 RepID=UPI002283539E|nr:DUF1366 domain-containing protein [Streptococcus gallolyticus]MCY7152250.1 DUF1366 domain-containing protein [Streptococcus gallolyticus subsp. gallolyticus]
MKLKFGSKSQEFAVDGTVTGTKVTLTNDEGAFYPVMLPADKISLSNSELEEAALEVIYQENFPQRAENEKFNEIGEKIAKYDEMIDKMQAAINESKTATATVNEVLNSLLEQLFGANSTTQNTEG